jgi:glycosyltransferase involved in cell wall biosynthesis
MALKVRDEGDVLEANLRYHHALGVDRFVVTDNGSTDETPKILSRYAEAGLARVINEPNTDYRAQGAAWLTEMARIAFSELDADWVIHTDADEFWLPVEGSLADVLGAIPARYGVVVAPRTEFVGRPDGPGSFAERLTIREARSRLQPKVAHRADPDAVVISQTHEVASAGPGRDLWLALRPPGRMVHRGTRGTAEEDGARPEIRLVWAPTHPLRIFHFPLRSFAQFRKRTEIFIRHGGWRDTGRFRRLRRHYEAGRLEELYAELVWDDAQVAEGIRDGELVRDERFAKLLPRCPDPMSGAPAGSVRVEPEPEQLESERAEVEYDAMRLMARTQRFTMLQLDRTRDRIDELHGTLDRVRAKLNRTLGRRLLKLARRVTRRGADDEFAPPPSRPQDEAEG